MKAGVNGRMVHMVCPRLLELDRRHGDHAAGVRHPFNHDPEHKHTKKCGCLFDPEGHRAATVVIPPGGELEDDHLALRCSCGRSLVVGEEIAGEPG